jgi:ATP-binding protein involved in chromosome partitioning
VYCCPNCGHSEHIFGVDGGKQMAQKMGLAYLGALPLQRAIREQSDAGRPPLVADPGSEVSGLYKSLARQAAVAVARLGKDYAAKFPTITVSKST